MMSVSIPESHRDLLVEPVHAVLSTMMPDGQPQSCIVWADYDGEHVLFSTTLKRQKGRNMTVNPKVALLVVDPKNGNRWIQVRGAVADIIDDVDETFVDKLTRLYTDNRSQHYYGDIFPAEKRFQETRVIVKIKPLKISLDAIFS